MKKEFPIKPTPEQMKTIKKYYKIVEKLEARYIKKVASYEYWLEQITGIKGIEFFFCEGELAGVGNRTRTMELIQRKKLIKGGV